MWSHPLIFPWKVNSEIVCVRFVPFETIALCMQDMLLRLDLCEKIDNQETVEHLSKICITGKQAIEQLNAWKKTPKGIRGCGDLFLCKPHLYQKIVAATHYVRITAATLLKHKHEENMHADDTPYHVLSTCIKQLDMTLDDFPPLMKCVANAKQLANAKKHAWDAKRHHDAKNYGAAFGHVNELNRAAATSTGWLD